MNHIIPRQVIDETRKAFKCGVKAALAEIHPGAAVYTRVDGGYIAFDTYAEYETWRAQR